MATKQELVAILRRFDMDGDAKINFKEFELGIKSSLNVFEKTPVKKRPRSGVTYNTKKLTSTPSKLTLNIHRENSNFGGRIEVTPRSISSNGLSKKKVRSATRIS